MKNQLKRIENSLPILRNILNFFFVLHLKSIIGASLVAQWLRIHLLMQETRVQALVREEPTCRRATKPVRHNY